MIAIIAAMDEEINALKELMIDVKEDELLSRQLFFGKLDNKDIILAKSGVGKVAAALTASIILSNYEVEYLINIGSAGSLKLEMDVESVIIPPVVTYHDVDVYGENWLKNFQDEKITFHADEKLLEAAYRLKDDKTFFKPHVSGDMFVEKDSQVQKILEEFPDAYSVEMEACAIAEACSVYKVPFIIVRSISDVTVKSDNHTEFHNFILKASKQSALYCQKLINEVENEH